MGPKNACSFAELAMGLIDEKDKLGGAMKPLLWWRYRDDVFDVWTHGSPKLPSTSIPFVPLSNLNWYILSMLSMSWILHCIFKIGSLLRIFTLSLQIANFICPFPVLTRRTVKGRFLMRLLYALDAIFPPMSFKIKDVSNTKGI